MARWEPWADGSGVPAARLGAARRHPTPRARLFFGDPACARGGQVGVQGIANGRARHCEWAWPIRHARWERRACGPPRRSSASSAACTQSRARSHLSTSLAPVRRAWAQFDGSARVDRATAHWWRAATGVRCARRLRSDCGACATHLGPGHAAPPAVRSVWPCWQVAF